jgi:hypothetical protein
MDRTPLYGILPLAAAALEGEFHNKSLHRPKAAWLSVDFSALGVILKSMGSWSFPLFSKTYLHAERPADPFELGTDLRRAAAHLS